MTSTEQLARGSVTTRYWSVGADVPEDGALWHSLASADEAAFRELFIRHSDAVYNFAFRRTSSWTLAEDITQNTFTTLWRAALDGRIDRLELDSARPVLLSMARNECSNAVRTKVRHLRLVDRIGRQAREAEYDDSQRWVESESAMANVRAALDVLPKNQREIVELVAWSELSMAEAAAVLDIPVGTVKSRYARARERLAHTRLAAQMEDRR